MSVMHIENDAILPDVELALVEHLSAWQKRYDIIVAEESDDVLAVLKADTHLTELGDRVHDEVRSLGFLPGHILLCGRESERASLERLMAIQQNNSKGPQGARFMVSPATARVATFQGAQPLVANTADAAWLNPPGSEKGW